MKKSNNLMGLWILAGLLACLLVCLVVIGAISGYVGGVVAVKSQIVLEQPSVVPSHVDAPVVDERPLASMDEKWVRLVAQFCVLNQIGRAMLDQGAIEIRTRDPYCWFHIHEIASILSRYPREEVLVGWYGNTYHQHVEELIHQTWEGFRDCEPSSSPSLFGAANPKWQMDMPFWHRFDKLKRLDQVGPELRDGGLVPYPLPE